MEEGLVKFLVESGTIGIVFALLFYSAWKDRMYNKTMNNHLEHETESRDKLTESLVGLQKTIENIDYQQINVVGVLNRATNAISSSEKTIERVERKLE